MTEKRFTFAAVRDSVATKSAGFYVGVVGAVFAAVQVFAYIGVDEALYSSGVIPLAVTGIALFCLLSLLRVTSGIAPVALMLFDFLSFCAFAKGEGLIDYFSTQFFDGVSLSKILSLGFSVYGSILFMVLSFVAASVAMYLPQNKPCQTVSARQTDVGGESL